MFLSRSIKLKVRISIIMPSLKPWLLKVLQHNLLWCKKFSPTCYQGKNLQEFHNLNFEPTVTHLCHGYQQVTNLLVSTWFFHVFPIATSLLVVLRLDTQITFSYWYSVKGALILSTQKPLSLFVLFTYQIIFFRNRYFFMCK